MKKFAVSVAMIIGIIFSQFVAIPQAQAYQPEEGDTAKVQKYQCHYCQEIYNSVSIERKNGALIQSFSQPSKYGCSKNYNNEHAWMGGAVTHYRYDGSQWVEFEYETAFEKEQKRKQEIRDRIKRLKTETIEMYKQGNYTQVIKNCDMIIGVDPYDFRSYVIRGTCYYQLKQYDEALQDYATAFQLNKNTEISQMIGVILNDRGYMYQNAREYNLALNDYENALKLYPHPTVYANRGAVYYYLGNYSQALSDLNKAIKNGLSGENLGEAYYYLGLCYRAKGDNKKAQSNFVKAQQNGWQF